MNYKIYQNHNMVPFKDIEIGQVFMEYDDAYKKNLPYIKTNSIKTKVTPNDKEYVIINSLCLETNLFDHFDDEHYVDLRENTVLLIDPPDILK